MAGLNSTALRIDSRLLNLVSLRIAQIHGCTHCVAERARQLGMTRQALQSLECWREQSVFSDREEAALNLAEVLTVHPIATAPKKAVHIASFFFNEDEMLGLTLRILAENDWHLLAGKCATKIRPRPPHE